jgi:hypothetical protein
MTPEAREWLALNRAFEGAVVKIDGSYVNAGSSVAGYLAEIFEALIDRGLLMLGRPSAGGHQRVCLTRTGQTRYAVLCRGQHITGNGTGSR